MKTTVDIPDKLLRDVMKATKARTKRAAIVQVLEEYDRRRRMSELTKYSGTFDSLMTNEEIEGLDLQRQRRNFGPKFKWS